MRVEFYNSYTEVDKMFVYSSPVPSTKLNNYGVYLKLLEPRGFIVKISDFIV